MEKKVAVVWTFVRHGKGTIYVKGVREKRKNKVGKTL
jgi:hypothetical protein